MLVLLFTPLVLTSSQEEIARQRAEAAAEREAARRARAAAAAAAANIGAAGAAGSGGGDGGRQGSLPPELEERIRARLASHQQLASAAAAEAAAREEIRARVGGRQKNGWVAGWGGVQGMPTAARVRCTREVLAGCSPHGMRRGLGWGSGRWIPEPPVLVCLAWYCGHLGRRSVLRRSY